MEQIIKETFDRISMDEQKVNEIRECLIKKRRTYSIMKWVACAAVFIAVLLFIPSTRTFIVNAANKVINIFHTANGGEVVYDEADNELSFSITYPRDSYVKVEGEKIYLTVGDKCIDVTDYCGEDKYYRYEIVNPDGSKNIILVGGTPENAGYVELIYDSNGSYVFNTMDVPCDKDGMAPAWVELAMHNEGVPTGNAELDVNTD